MGKGLEALILMRIIQLFPLPTHAYKQDQQDQSADDEVVVDSFEKGKSSAEPESFARSYERGGEWDPQPNMQMDNMHANDHADAQLKESPPVIEVVKIILDLGKQKPM